MPAGAAGTTELGIRDALRGSAEMGRSVAALRRDDALATQKARYSTPRPCL